MGVGTSILLVAVGAIMRFAITAQASGFSIQTIGLILMIVGVVGFVISLFFWNSWGGFGSGAGVYRGRTVVTQSQAPATTAMPAAPVRTTVTRTDQTYDDMAMAPVRTTITRTDEDYA